MERQADYDGLRLTIQVAPKKNMVRRREKNTRDWRSSDAATKITHAERPKTTIKCTPRLARVVVKNKFDPVFIFWFDRHG